MVLAEGGQPGDALELLEKEAVSSWGAQLGHKASAAPNARSSGSSCGARGSWWRSQLSAGSRGSSGTCDQTSRVASAMSAAAPAQLHACTHCSRKQVAVRAALCSPTC